MGENVTYMLILNVADGISAEKINPNPWTKFCEALIKLSLPCGIISKNCNCELCNYHQADNVFGL